MDASTVAETFRQIIGGDDIPKIDYLLKRTTSEQASRKLPGWPYSILTNLEHADFWQRIWLGRLTGGKKPSFTKDWRVPASHEFEAVRASFLANLRLAHEIASAQPFTHKMVSDEAAVKTLVALAVHDAYHIGQIKLMARMLAAGDSA